MIRALADAGHCVDLAAPASDVSAHPLIRIVPSMEGRSPHKNGLRMACLRAVGRGSYDAVHAVDDAVFFAMYLCRWKKIPLVYDASRRFSGDSGIGGGWLMRLFPKHLMGQEARVLDRSKVVLSSCSMLSSDLRSMSRELNLEQLEDVPMQSFYGRGCSEKSLIQHIFDAHPEAVVACCLLSSDSDDLRNLLLAARKVVDALPEAVFVFRGVVRHEKAVKMAESLDIAKNCSFLSDEDAEAFLSVLEISNAVLMIPPKGGRYVHAQVYTLLHAAAPLVSVHHSAYDEVLTEETSVCVFSGSDAIAEGLLRVIQEPLFSRAVAAGGQQLVASTHAYSSFKHRVRMIYRELTSGKE
jgi:hypothetical protein